MQSEAQKSDSFGGRTEGFSPEGTGAVTIQSSVLERTAFLSIQEKLDPRSLTPVFNHEEAQRVRSARQPTFRYVRRAGVESPSMVCQGIWATTLTWKSVSKVKDVSKECE